MAAIDSKGIEQVFDLISEEHVNQLEKWGVQRHSPLKWAVILSEETGEVAKAVLDEDEDGLIAELTQVAAVATACLRQVLDEREGRRAEDG